MTRLQALTTAFLLILLFFRLFSFYSSNSGYQDGQYIYFKTTLLSEPQLTGRVQRFTAYAQDKKILIILSRYPEFHYGDSLSVKGNIKYRISKHKERLLTMSYPKIEADRDKRNSILAIISAIRQKIITLFEKTLPPVSSSLLLGIVFGIRSEMPREFIDKLRLSGIMHIIAASGMNVTMVAGFLSSIFSLILKRQIALILSIAGIVFYAVIAGLEPSIIRAAIMGILGFSAQILGRQRLASYGLFMAGFSMLFISPLLIFDIGFQLSFLATLGLLSLRPLMSRIPLSGQDIATTTAAQIATFPVLIANFGTYSLWSIVVNGLTLWIIPPLMILGGIGAILGTVSEPVGKLFLYFSFPFLLYLEKIVTFFTDFGGVVSVEGLPLEFILGYYLILLSIIIILNKKHENKL